MNNWKQLFSRRVRTFLRWSATHLESADVPRSALISSTGQYSMAATSPLRLHARRR